MKKLSEFTKQDLKNIERSLIQDLSDEQANQMTGGTIALPSLLGQVDKDKQLGSNRRKTGTLFIYDGNGNL
jgi:hypothetical protein